MFNRRDFVNSDKFSGRDYDVLTQSPQLFKRSNTQRDSLSTQLNKLMPVTKVSGLSDEERLENKRIQSILRPQLDEEVHHQNGLGLIGTVLNNADDEGKEQIYRLLEHNNIPIGDNILNLINLDKAGHDELHAFAQKEGLEIMRNGTVGIAKKLAESKNIDETLEYLQDYINKGVPRLREKQDDIITAYYDDSDSDIYGSALDELISEIRMANPKVLGNYNKLKASAGARADSPGTSRERVANIDIDSDGGDVTIGDDLLRSNGKNGNGNGKH